MIGGTDIILPIHEQTEALDLVVRAVLRLWPHAVIEDVDAEEVLPPYEFINFHGRSELLVFHDQGAADKWDELGADPSLNDTLIHVLLSEGELTLSLDDEPSPKVKMFVQSLRKALRQDLFTAKAEMKDAA